MTMTITDDHRTQAPPAPDQAPRSVQQKPQRNCLMPVNGDELVPMVEGYYRYAWWTNERYQVLASRWALLDSWLRLVVALAAALSALSLFADNAEVTAVFAVVTAVVSALNAAWNPAERAKTHRVAAQRYGHMERPFGSMLSALHSRLRTVYGRHRTIDPDNGQVTQRVEYFQRELTKSELERYWTELNALVDKLEKIDDEAPPLNRLFATPEDGVPRTRLGVWREKRRMRRQKQLADYRHDLFDNAA